MIVSKGIREEWGKLALNIDSAINFEIKLCSLSFLAVMILDHVVQRHILRPFVFLSYALLIQNDR